DAVRDRARRRRRGGGGADPAGFLSLRRLFFRGPRARALAHLLRGQPVDRRRRGAEDAEPHVDLAAVGDLVLGHQAEPRAGRDRGAARRHALLLEIGVRQGAEDLDTLGVAAVEVRAHRLEAVRELAAVPGIAGGTAERVLGVHVTLDAREVAHEIAERELAGL